VDESEITENTRPGDRARPRMSYEHYKVLKLQPHDELPYELLLLADETTAVIQKYIYDCDVYVIKEKNESLPVAVFALYRISDRELEIRNIAVSEFAQGQGLGSQIIHQIKRIAILAKFKRIIVGTPSVSPALIRFYEKNGFSKYDLRKGFYLKYYPAPIVESGVMLRDMLLLKQDL
jgi:ribosomal protein S18 acetylase RimI-like enzyme